MRLVSEFIETILRILPYQLLFISCCSCIFVKMVLMLSNSPTMKLEALLSNSRMDFLSHVICLLIQTSLIFRCYQNPDYFKYLIFPSCIENPKLCFFVSTSLNYVKMNKYYYYEHLITGTVSIK